MTDIFQARSAQPMLLTEQREPFDSTDFIYELKLDGIRSLAYLEEGATDLRNKENMALVHLFPELADIHLQADRPCILDGELVVMENGKPSFERLQRRALSTNPFKIKLAKDQYPASFVAYDILYLNGKALYDLPLLERKNILARAVRETARLAVSRFTPKEGITLYNNAAAMELEGIVAKRTDSLYHPGSRTKDWIKIKNLIDEDFIACGYILKGSLVSLVLGKQANGQLVYEGHVTLGVPGQTVRSMETGRHSPFSQTPPGHEDAIWFSYMPLCTVRYMMRTSGGGMRQPVFKAFRTGMLH